MRVLAAIVAFLVVVVLFPSTASAQASITGVVRDASGAVLPGVTVEAASPVLIEKVRVVTTDGSGQYRIVDLRPGTYALTVTLPGFATVKREGVELRGSFTAVVDADMRVGRVEETLTVTGESPLVDVQSTTQQQVLEQSVVNALPVGRQVGQYALLFAPVVGAGGAPSKDVGGFEVATAVSAHGSRLADVRFLQNGLPTGGFGAPSGVHFTPNIGSHAEVVVDVAAVSAERGEGGPRINFIPRDGGNTYSGTAFASGAVNAMQGDNFTQRVKDQGLVATDRLKNIWDFTGGIGGPLRKDQVWFYFSTRFNGFNQYAGGILPNRNAGNPNAWLYEADTSPEARNQAVNNANYKSGALRLTWQASPKNKVAFTWEQQTKCRCDAFVGLVTSQTGGGPPLFNAPEAGSSIFADPQRSAHGEWSAPLTNRVLVQLFSVYNYSWGGWKPPQGPSADGFSPVIDLASGLTYRASVGFPGAGTGPWRSERLQGLFMRGAVSYVPGAHSFKIGFNHAFGSQLYIHSAASPVTYTFNAGTPTSMTLYANPFDTEAKYDADFGVYGQDTWTIRRATLTLGLRYDYYAAHYPEQRVGPGPLAPTRNVTFPVTQGPALHDVTPRMGFAYDLFGDSRTAVKASLNKYLGTVGGVALGVNPVALLRLSTTRSWNDRAGLGVNGDYVPQCELLNPAANGECGALADRLFGSTDGLPSSEFDPGVNRGFGNREYNWEFSTGVQHQLLQNLAVEVSYFRRWFGNFVVTDNRAIGPGDFSPFSITAPQDSRLPDGGGYVISGLYNLNPDRFGVPARNFVTFADNYGKQQEHWNGVDFSAQVRSAIGLVVNSGVSTGRLTTDRCDVVAKLDNPSPLYCRVQGDFQTQVKMLATYTVPRIDVQLSGTFQSLQGVPVVATYVASNAEVARTLGRNLSGNAQNVTVNIVEPDTMFEERLNQLDLSIAKVVRFGRTRSTFGVELFNALNADTITVTRSAYATWRQASKALMARYVKLSMTLDF